MEGVWEGGGHVNVGGGNRAYWLSLPPHLCLFVCLFQIYELICDGTWIRAVCKWPDSTM